MNDWLTPKEFLEIVNTSDIKHNHPVIEELREKARYDKGKWPVPVGIQRGDLLKLLGDSWVTVGVWDRKNNKYVKPVNDH